MQRYGIYFNNKMSSDLDLIVNEISIPKSNRNFTEEPIEGRNGALIYDQGTYDNKVITVKFTYMGIDMRQAFRKIDKWIYNITDARLRLEDPSRCYRVLKAVYGTPEKQYKTVRKFSIDFKCKSFEEDFIETKKHITSFTSASTIFINGDVNSLPVIEITGSANASITVNDKTFTIVDMGTYALINTELQEATNNNKLNYTKLTGDFPVFVPGKNTVTFSNVTDAKISYRNMYK